MPIGAFVGNDCRQIARNVVDVPLTSQQRFIQMRMTIHQTGKNLITAAVNHSRLFRRFQLCRSGGNLSLLKQQVNG
jgi:hypothetical protein